MMTEAAGFLVGAALLFWRMRWEMGAIELNHHTVTLERKSLASPLRILHLSDIHFAGPDPAIARFFDELAVEHYDLVVISGDILDCPKGLPECAENLRKLRARNGIFAVLGNHDYFDYGFVDVLFHNFPGQSRPRRLQATHALVRVLEEAGVRVLRNETVDLTCGGTPVQIHGLDDATIGRANVRTAMARYDPSRINLLLSHNLDVFLDIGRDEIDLAFSGHTHGGQFRLPWFGPLYTHTRTGRRYACGIHKLKGAVCCVSRGMGCGRSVPFRLLCRPEAVVLTVCGS
ncbi:MAG: metallophosphoesterase [Candidatus Omnitrophota bacterium]|jgi:hypothetical protein